jgi:hypothetical protein
MQRDGSSAAIALVESLPGTRVVFMILAQQPNAHGRIRDAAATAQRSRHTGIELAEAVDP